MRFHLLALPWTMLTDDYSWCAYTQRVRRFCKMMGSRGHHVMVYGPDEYKMEHVGEYVVCITRGEQGDLLGTRDAPWDQDHPLWVTFNERAAVAVADRKQPRDFLLLTTSVQWPVVDHNSDMQAVEYGIGYQGTRSKLRVFESYAWMHTIYGAQDGANCDGRWYDTVIPNYFDPDDFQAGDPDPDPYFLFMGRGIGRKGPQIAADVAEHLGVRLVLAGDDLGGFPTYGERLGPLTPPERKVWMSGAVALFAPTLYVGPFEGVAVEALLSGCPVICTDYGAFTETIQHGDGWRCSTMAEFVDAGRLALYEVARTPSDPPYARRERRDRAIARFSLDAVAPRYERYFRNLLELWDTPGWPQLEHPPI